MDIKIVTNSKYSKLEQEFGAKIAYREISLGPVRFITISKGHAGRQYAAAGLLQAAIQEALMFEKFKRLQQERE